MSKSFKYNKNKKRLTFFSNGKPIGGLIGKIATRKFEEIKQRKQNSLKSLI